MWLQLNAIYKQCLLDNSIPIYLQSLPVTNTLIYKLWLPDTNIPINLQCLPGTNTLIYRQGLPDTNMFDLQTLPARYKHTD